MHQIYEEDVRFPGTESFWNVWFDVLRSRKESGEVPNRQIGKKRSLPDTGRKRKDEVPRSICVSRGIGKLLGGKQNKKKKKAKRSRYALLDALVDELDRNHRDFVLCGGG
jgi:hypothetical protein